MRAGCVHGCVHGSIACVVGWPDPPDATDLSHDVTNERFHRVGILLKRNRPSHSRVEQSLVPRRPTRKDTASGRLSRHASSRSPCPTKVKYELPKRGERSGQAADYLLVNDAVIVVKLEAVANRHSSVDACSRQLKPRINVEDLPPCVVQPKSSRNRFCLLHRKTGPVDQAHYRKYGPGHRALRARWARQVEAGTVECARCGEPITLGSAWDLGHQDGTLSYAGLEHARCNGRRRRIASRVRAGRIRTRGSGDAAARIGPARDAGCAAVAVASARARVGAPGSGRGFPFVSRDRLRGIQPRTHLRPPVAIRQTVYGGEPT